MSYSEKLRENGRLNIAGLYMRKYRETHQMSMREFAAFLEVRGLDWDYNIVERMENGKRMITDLELIRLAEVLNADIKDLVSADLLK